MTDKDRNICYEAFSKLCETVREDNLLSITEAQY